MTTKELKKHLYENLLKCVDEAEQGIDREQNLTRLEALADIAKDLYPEEKE